MPAGFLVIFQEIGSRIFRPPVCRTYVCISSIADELPAVKRTELEVFSGGGKSAKIRAKQPGTLPFASISTGLKTDPGAF